MSQKHFGKQDAFIDECVAELQRGQKVFVVCKTGAEAKRVLLAVRGRVTTEQLEQLTINQPPSSEGTK